MNKGSSEGGFLGAIVVLVIIGWIGYLYLFPENGEFRKFNAHPSDYIGKNVSIDNATIEAFRIEKGNDEKYSGVVDFYVVGEGRIGLFVDGVNIDERTIEAMKNNGSFKVEFICSDTDKILNKLTKISEK